ncbi:hypothetical protein [Variovorax defluvii]
MDTPDRSYLHFVRKVREAFAFLTDEGFVEIDALPTLVRFHKSGIEVDVYHGRQSYELGAGVTFSGTRYAMSEIVRATDPEAAKGYRNAVATTPEGVAAGLEALSSLMERYGSAALKGHAGFFSMLEAQRRQWLEEYTLDVLASQLRPKADDAFRRGDYSAAAALYGRIRDRLSPAETKKLALAEGRSRRP